MLKLKALLGDPTSPHLPLPSPPLFSPAGSPAATPKAPSRLSGSRLPGGSGATPSPPPPHAVAATGMPLYTALAALLGVHRQEVRAAFGARPVFLGEEAVLEADAAGQLLTPK
jgi:hypothetical protein